MSKEPSQNEWRDELNDDITDGGGCVEAWEATQSRRNTGRRTFLAGVVGSLLTGMSASKVVAINRGHGSNGEDLQTEVVELGEQETGAALSELFGDREALQIHREFLTEGFRRDDSQAEAYRVRYEGDSWVVVNLPYVPHGSRSQSHTESQTVAKVDAGLTWSSRGDFDSVGYISEASPAPDAEISADIQEAMEDENIQYSRDTTTPVEVSLTTVAVDDPGVHTETNSRTVPLENSSTTGDVNTEDFSDCYCTVITALCSPCGTPDWGCINTLAGAYAAEIGACSVCAAEPTKLTCVPCLGAIAEQLASGETPICCFCDTWDLPW